MPTPFLNVTPVTAGQNNKEITLNDADLALEHATQATLSVDMSAGDVTLTVEQFTRNAVFVLTGATMARDCIIPSDVGAGANTARRVFNVQNTSGFSVTVKVLGETGVTVLGGYAGVLTLDGTDASALFLTDSVNVDSILDWKNSVRVATTSAGTLSTSFEDGDTIDGVTLVTDDRILIKDQAAGAENGIYIITAGAPIRASDANTSTEITSGMATIVEEGSLNGDKLFVLTTNGTIVLDTTALDFSALSGASSGPNNNFAATTNPTANDDVNQTSPGPYTVGSHWVNVTLDTVYVCVDSTDSAAVWNQVDAAGASGPNNNFAAVTDPGVNDDVNAGSPGPYVVGSHWINTTLDTAYICVDSTDTAAVWNQVDASGSGPNNNFVAVTNPGVNDDVNAGSPGPYTVGSRWINTTLDTAYVCVDSTDTAAVWNQVDAAGASGPNNNFAATTNPTANDDVNQTSPGPYTVGSHWVNVTLDTVYVCVDSTDSAAVWNQVDAAGASGPNNNFAAVTDPGVTDDINQTSPGPYVVGSHWVNVTLDTVYVCVDSTDGGAIWVLTNAPTGPNNNFTSISNPSVNDDDNSGTPGPYSVGSHWINVTLDTAYVCVDSTNAAAVWNQVDAAGASGPNNNFAAVTDPSVNDDVNSGAPGPYTVGSHWVNVTLDTTYVCVDSTDTAAVWNQVDAAAASGPNNNFAAVTNPTASDDINQTSPGPYVVGSRWINVTLDTAYVCVDSTDTAAVWKQIDAAGASGPNNNFVAVTDPGVNDDVNSGSPGPYTVGSHWVNVTLDTTYVCVDSTDTAAVWNQVDAAGGASTTQEFISKTADYTPILADAGKLVRITKAVAGNLIVPPNSSVAYALGTLLHITSAGSGQISVISGVGVTINSPETIKLEKRYSKASLMKIATDEWDLSGDLQAGTNTVGTNTVPVIEATSLKVENTDINSVTIDKPTGTEENDLLVAHLGWGVSGAANVFATPAGWTKVFGDIYTNVSQVVYYKIAGDSEPADYTFTKTSGAGTEGTGALLRISNTRTSNPIIYVDEYGNTDNGTSITAPQSLSDHTNSLRLGFAVVTGSRTFLPPAGFSEEYDQTNDESDVSNVATSGASKSVAASGIDASASFTASAISDRMGMTVIVENGDAPAVDISTGHRYWRFYGLRTGGNTQMNARECEFLLSSVDQTGSGTASADNGTAANAFDNDTGTEWISTAAWSLVYDFGSDQVIDAFSWTLGGTFSRRPSNFAIQYSDDNTNWVTVKTFLRNDTWSIGEKKTFTL